MFEVSTHRGRQEMREDTVLRLHFNSRPHRGRLVTLHSPFLSTTFQLTPSQRATHPPGVLQSDTRHFNSRPHRGRQGYRENQQSMDYFNSRPHRGRRKVPRGLMLDEEFQLTPSQRATITLLFPFVFSKYFNSRPHRGRRRKRVSGAPQRIISTHALTEGDNTAAAMSERQKEFQLTPSQRATMYSVNDIQTYSFQLTPSQRATIDQLASMIKKAFQLTPSQRATIGFDLCFRGVDISTHALTEGDRAFQPMKSAMLHFNSRPHRGRH